MLPGNQIDWQDSAIALGFSIVLAFIVAQVVARVARFVLLKLTFQNDPSTFTSPIVKRQIRIARTVAFVITMAIVSPLALNTVGINVSYGFQLETIILWFFESGLRITLIVVLAYFVIKIFSMLVVRFEVLITQRSETDLDKMEIAQRMHTLAGLIRNTITVLVTSVAGLMILRELRVDIMPVLTGAGIAGLAVGFGAQNLVRDVIGGFFLILEDQVHVGDVAIANGTGGLVEAVNLRTIVLRDLSGTVHVIPNGTITQLANMTRGFSYYVIDVGVAYKEDTDVVTETLREIGAELAEDPIFKPSILGPLEILGVDAFQDSQVTIKIRIKTVPMKQWEVGRELRRRIKKTFDQRGIEIPFPHMSLYFGEASNPFAVQSKPSL